MLHGSSSQIKVAVLKAQILVRDYWSSVFVYLINHEGQDFALGKHLDFLGYNLHLSSGHFWVNHGIGATTNNSFHSQAIFHLQVQGQIHQVSWGIRIHHHLSQAVTVSQVDKRDATVVSLTVNPSIQYNSLSNVSLAQVATGDGSSHIFHGMQYSIEE